MPNFWDYIEGTSAAGFEHGGSADLVNYNSNGEVMSVEPFGEREGYFADDAHRAPWDVVILNGWEVPGIAKVTCTARIRLDLPKKLGRDGATIIDNGHEPAIVGIAIEMWHPRQWEQFLAGMETLWRMPGETPLRFVRQKVTTKGKTTEVPRFLGDPAKSKQAEIAEEVEDLKMAAKSAIRIFHPCCASMGVTSIVLEEYSGAEVDDRGVGTVRLRARQYIPAKEVDVTTLHKGTGKGRDATLDPAVSKAINSLDPPPSVSAARAEKP